MSTPQYGVQRAGGWWKAGTYAALEEWVCEEQGETALKRRAGVADAVIRTLRGGGILHLTQCTLQNCRVPL